VAGIEEIHSFAGGCHLIDASGDLINKTIDALRK